MNVDWLARSLITVGVFLAPATVTIVSERRRLAPWGLAGGGPGAPGRNTLIPSPSQGEDQGEGAPPSPSKGEGRVRVFPSKCQLAVQPGDTLTIETSGGGGWGEPGSVPCGSRGD